MMIIEYPSAANHFLGYHAELILSSFKRITGKILIDEQLSAKDRYRALFNAPFCVLSHNTEEDPVFNYGNRMALEVFEMKWEDFTIMASKHSAEPQNREERKALLARVTENGFIDNYKGVRVSSTGKRFFVEDAVVWNMIDEKGDYCGQGAVLYRWVKL